MAGGEKLKEVDRDGIMIRIYYVRKKLFKIKGKNEA